MLLTLIIPALLVLVAILIRGWAEHHSRLVAAVAILAPAAAIGLLVIQVLKPNSMMLLHWQDDSLARMGLIVATCVALIVSMQESSPHLLATTFWSAGMLALLSVSSSPGMQWGALQFTILPLLFYGRTASAGFADLIHRNATLILGSVLFGCGFWLVTLVNANSPAATIGIVLLICGLGGMLGWFPFPHIFSQSVDDEAPGSVFGKRFLPLMTAAVLLYRLVERQPLATYPSTLVALAALYSLALCGTRLLHEERLSRRLVLSALSTFSFLLIVICLQNWEFSNAERDWLPTSNLWGGQAMFVSVLACEAAGLLVMTCGLRLLQTDQAGQDFSQVLSGAAIRRPLPALITSTGLLTLAGLPPLPGFWWKFALITALLLPHRLSNVTHLTEVDHQFALLALLLLVLQGIHSVGHLRLLMRMLFDEPFRLRSEPSPWKYRIPAGISLLLLAMVVVIPLSLSSFLSLSGEADIVNSLPGELQQTGP